MWIGGCPSTCRLMPSSLRVTSTASLSTMCANSEAAAAFAASLRTRQCTRGGKFLGVGRDQGGAAIDTTVVTFRIDDDRLAAPSDLVRPGFEWQSGCTDNFAETSSKPRRVQDCGTGISEFPASREFSRDFSSIAPPRRLPIEIPKVLSVLSGTFPGPLNQGMCQRIREFLASWLRCAKS